MQILLFFQLLAESCNCIRPAKFGYCHNMMSVSSSVTPVCCDKTSEARITRFSVKSSTMPQLLCTKFKEKYEDVHLDWGSTAQTREKGKVLPHSLPSVGPGADPGVQAVRLQVTISHLPAVGCH